MSSQNAIVSTGLSSQQAQAVVGSPKNGLVAAGTTQATALSLPAALNSFAMVAAGAGAILPAGAGGGDCITIFNGGANDLLVYPPAGGSLDGGATNAPFTHVAGASGIYWCMAKSTWVTLAKGTTGGLTGTGVAGDAAVWSGASNLVANTALVPITAIYIGASAFPFLEPSPGVLQLGDAQITYVNDLLNNVNVLKIVDNFGIPNGTTGFAVQSHTISATDYLQIQMTTSAESGNLGVGLVPGPTYSGGGRQVGFTNETPDDGGNAIYVVAGDAAYQFFDNTSGLGLVPDVPCPLGGPTSPWSTGYFGTSVVVGATPFTFRESSPGVLQLGDANLKWTASAKTLTLGAAGVGGELNSETLYGSDATGLLLNGTLTGINPQIFLNAAGSISATTFAGEFAIVDQDSAAGFHMAAEGTDWSPLANNAQDLGTTSFRYRSGFFGTSVVTPLLTTGGGAGLTIKPAAGDDVTIESGTGAGTAVTIKGHQEVDLLVGSHIAVLDSAGLFTVEALFSNKMAGPAIATPSAPIASSGVIYFKTVGGKVALFVLFPSGAEQQIKIEA